jgi:hypothetical protein
MVPMLSICLDDEEGAAQMVDVLLPSGGSPAEWSGAVLERLQQLASGSYTPLALRSGNVDFQIARGGSCSL